MTLGIPCEPPYSPAFEGSSNPVLQVAARIASRAAQTGGKDNPACRTCNPVQPPSCNTSSPRSRSGSFQRGRPEYAIPMGTA